MAHTATDTSAQTQTDTGTAAQTAPSDLGPMAKTVWPCLVFEDCLVSIDFLVRAFGFVSTATYALEDEPTVVEHAELRWPEGGGIMCGSPGRDDSEFSKQPSGSGSLYVVTDHPDELCERSSPPALNWSGACATRTTGRVVHRRKDPEGEPVELRHLRRAVIAPPYDVGRSRKLIGPF